MLFSQDSTQFDNWKSSDPNKRKKSFKPVDVRIALQKKEIPIPIKNELYGYLSERFVHISPNTRPELHSNMDRPVASGTFQESGVKNAINYMAFFISQLALTSTLLLKPDNQISEYIANLAIKLKDLKNKDQI